MAYTSEDVQKQDMLRQGKTISCQLLVTLSAMTFLLTGYLAILTIIFSNSTG